MLRRMDGQQTDLPDIVTSVSLALHFYLVKRNSTFFYYKILLFTRNFMCFYLKTWMFIFIQSSFLGDANSLKMATIIQSR